MKVLLPLVLSSLASQALAQRVDATPAAPTRALAAANVRREADAAKSKPPVVATAQALGAGTGPLALLLRRADGSLHVHELQHGDSEPGAAVDPRRKTPLAPDDVAATVAAARAAAHGPFGPRVLLGRRDAQVTLGTTIEPLAVAVEQLDRDTAVKFFRRQREQTAEATGVVLVAAADTTMQQLVSAHEAALTAGFASVMVDGDAVQVPLAAADAEMLEGVQHRLGWRLVDRWGPRLTQSVYRGELLLLADADARWDAVAPVYRELIQRGIWQIAFACKRDDGTLVKLPVRVALPLR